MKKASQKTIKFIFVILVVFSFGFSNLIPAFLADLKNPSASNTGSFLEIKTVSAATEGDGIIVYGKSGTSAPQYRIYSTVTNTWSAEAAVGGATFSGTPRFVVAKTAPNREEAVVGVLNDTGTLFVVRWNGSAWSQLGSNINTGINPAVTKVFDIIYENASGDAIVVVGGAADPAYYIWNGSSWSGPTSITQATKTTGIIRWVELASRKTAGSDEIALAYADANGDLNALIWSGSAWTEQTAVAGALSTGIENNAAATTMRAFDVEYESLSGDLMITWGNSATVDPRYVTRTAAGVWSAVLTATTFVEIPSIMNIAAEPWDNRIAVGLQNDTTANSNDGDCGIWNGTGWVNTGNCDIARDSQEAGDMVLGSGWVKYGADVRAINFYSDVADLTLDYNYWVPGTGWTATQAFTPSPNCVSANSDDNSFVVDYNPYNNAEIMIVRQAGGGICTQKTNYAGANTFNFGNAGNGSSLAAPSISQYQPVGYAYFKYVSVSNSPPTLSVSQPPSGNTAIAEGSSYNITYTLADTDNVVTAAFYYDTNNDGVGGTAIAGACATAAEGTNATCSFNTGVLTPGTPYYIYGVTNDGVNPAVTAVSAGTLTVNDAPALSISQPDGVGDNVTIGNSYNVTYTLTDTDNVVTAAFYWDTNNDGIGGTAITGACATATEGTNTTCSWNTTGMSAGSYYVYGITNDGVNSAITAVSSGTITLSGGSVSVDIVDSGGTPIGSPSVSFASKSFSWTAQTATGTLGVSSQKMRVTSTLSTWSLTIGATSGPSALWTSGGNNYDYNGSASAGRLQVNPSVGTITPQGGCGAPDPSKGTSAYFDSGNSITLLSSSSSSGCYWDFTGVALTQDIPASQVAGSYSIGMTLTAS